MEYGEGRTSGVIDHSNIDAMLAQLKGAKFHARGPGAADDATSLWATTEASAHRTNFASILNASILKSSFDSVNSLQQQALQLSQRYTKGDDSVNLSDVMIALKKSDFGLTGLVQLRNKTMSAYKEIINMQV